MLQHPYCSRIKFESFQALRQCHANFTLVLYPVSFEFCEIIIPILHSLGKHNTFGTGMFYSLAKQWKNVQNAMFPLFSWIEEVKTRLYMYTPTHLT